MPILSEGKPYLAINEFHLVDQCHIVAHLHELVDHFFILHMIRTCPLCSIFLVIYIIAIMAHDEIRPLDLQEVCKPVVANAIKFVDERFLASLLYSLINRVHEMAFDGFSRKAPFLKLRGPGTTWESYMSVLLEKYYVKKTFPALEVGEEAFDSVDGM